MRILFLCIALLVSISSFSQEEKWRFGGDVGYTTKDYVPINAHIKYNDLYFGLGFYFPKTGKKVQEETSNQFFSSIRKGYYHVPITADFGKQFGNFIVGVGLGYAFKVNYEDYKSRYKVSYSYDWLTPEMIADGYFYYNANFIHFYGNNDRKWNSGGHMEAKLFVHYNFNTSPFLKWYLTAQASVTTGVGVGIGIDL